jgi:hypothetical protein
MNVEAFPHDPALPQLAIAVDELRMREAFQQQLRPRLGRSYELQACRLTRIRCRRGHRCLLQYDLRLVETGTGSEWKQRVTGSLYADGGRARHLYQKELRGAVASARSALPFEPFAFVPELEMFVQVFPYDRHLPALPELMQGPPIDFQSVLLARLGSDAWRIEEVSTETIRYRAGLGATLGYAMRFRNANTGEVRSQRFYLKAYPDARGAQTFQLLQQLHQQREQISPFLDLVQPIAWSMQSRALLLQQAPGVPLEELLLQGIEPATLQRMAGVLANLNQSPSISARQHTREDEMANLQRARARLQWACPHLRTDLERIVETVARNWVELPPAPVHRDLKTDHVLLDHDRMVLIDLDSFALAHPLLDPAQFLARLATLPYRRPVSRERARSAAAAFAEEYFARVPRDWRRGLAIHYAAAILDATQGFFGRQEPNWPETVSALVQEATDSLEGKIW